MYKNEYNICLCKTCSQTMMDIKNCLEVYNLYSWISNSYVLDFFVNNYWSRLPESWKNILMDMSLKEVAVMLDVGSQPIRVQKVWPLSILCLREIFKSVNIARQPHNIDYIIANHSILRETHSTTHINTVSDDNNILFNNPRFKSVLWKHISPKKKHEILLMAQICANTARRANCYVVLDFGSGLGHLSRILAYGFGLRVCCLEAQENLSQRAKLLDTEFEKMCSKNLTKSQFHKLSRPVHINMKIEKTTTVNDIIQKIRLALKTENALKFGIVGLHPCGDLAALLLRFFKENVNIKFINLVGCCYMKLTTENSSFSGYPLSAFVQSLPYQLSYAAREMSCHAIEVYIDRLKSEDIVELQIHAFRAALEKIIVKYWPEKKHTGLRSVKYRKDLTFSHYCHNATKGLDILILKEDILSTEIFECLAEWRKVVLFYSLRLMFAPMIETILLLDRFLYIAQPNIKCTLVPIFDPKLSPRCHILTAVRTF